MSPAGLNATGESDIATTTTTSKPIRRTSCSRLWRSSTRSFIRSTFNTRNPDIFYNWVSLWQMSETEKAALAKQKADTFKVDVDADLIPSMALAKARINQLTEDGTYPGLEAAIAEAEEIDELVEEMAAQRVQERARNPRKASPGKASREDFRRNGVDDLPQIFGPRAIYQRPPTRTPNFCGSGFVLERKCDACAKCRDLSVLHLHVHFGDFGHA